jgi:RNA polymerase sigma-70 factor (ECF subfamily)
VLQEIKIGNQVAFRQFYDDWSERLYLYFLKKTHVDQSAQELTQLTFIKFWEYRSTLTSEYPLEAQLFRKAKLIFIDFLRKSATKVKQKEAELSYHELNSGNKCSNSFEEKQQLRTALEQLPPIRRKVIELSHMEGYAYKEIAHQLKISRKTVDNHVYQALKQLRSILSLIFL